MSAPTPDGPAEVVEIQPVEPDRRGAATARRHDRGALIVEFAFVAPLLFAVLFGFVEVGLLVLGSSVGTNAAREGAREGILQYLDADEPASSSHAAIEDAVRARLAGLVDEDRVEVTVRCLDYDEVRAGAADPVKDCEATGDDGVVAGRDLLEVAVRWRPVALTGFISPTVRIDRARMTVVSRAPGGPSATTTTPADVPTLALGCTPATRSEADTSRAVTCTVTRSVTGGEPTVQYRTTDGTATSGADYEASSGVLTFLPGSTWSTFAVTIRDDPQFEPDEDFTVSLLGPSAAVLGSTVSQRVVIVSDDAEDVTAPTVVAARLEDSRVVNGKPDTIRILFSEPLGDCAGQGLVVDPLPNGAEVISIVRDGAAVVVNLREGSGGIPPGGVRVTHATNPAGLCDAAGNLVASFELTLTAVGP
jgi:hypothetical protein